MTLLLLLVLAAIPLLGVVWIAFYGSLTTVDGLFLSLILLAMSGILGATASSCESMACTPGDATSPKPGGMWRFSSSYLKRKAVANSRARPDIY